MKTLTPRELRAEWTSRKAAPVCYLYGEETALKDKAVKALEAAFKPESFNFSVRDAEVSGIEDALDEARTAPMLADLRFVVVKRVEKLKKEPLQRLLEYLADPCPSACLVLLADWPREKAKADPVLAALPASAAAADFSPLAPHQAAEYANEKLLAAGVKSDRRALEVLVETVGTSMASLESETDKVILFMHGKDRLFEAADVAGLAGTARELDPYEVVNAIRDRNPDAAAAAVAKQLEAGEEPIAVLMQVARSVDSLLKAFYISKSGEGQAACYAAGISPWQYTKLQRYASGFTEARLLHCLRRCLEAEELLKSSSKRDPALLVRQLIFEISRPVK